MKPIFYMFCAGLLLCACKKNDDYRVDGGLSNAVTPLSNYDYLKAHAYHQFDTVLQIIDHFNLKDSVNKAGTFFALTNYALSRALPSESGSTTKLPLDTLYSRKLITSRFITQYCFSQKISLANATVGGSLYASWAGVENGVKKKVSTAAGSYNGYTVYNLFFVKINGALDTNPATPGDAVDYEIICQTQGIQTLSGAGILNVFSNQFAPEWR